jgi:hypothetical protein
MPIRQARTFRPKAEALEPRVVMSPAGSLGATSGLGEANGVALIQRRHVSGPHVHPHSTGAGGHHSGRGLAAPLVAHTLRIRRLPTGHEHEARLVPVSVRGAGHPAPLPPPI